MSKDRVDLVEVSRSKLDRLLLFERRWNYVHEDPEGLRHLLHLLSLGKGDAADFDEMLDRIIRSRDAALEAEDE